MVAVCGVTSAERVSTLSLGDTDTLGLNDAEACVGSSESELDTDRSFESREKLPEWVGFSDSVCMVRERDGEACERDCDGSDLLSVAVGSLRDADPEPAAPALREREPVKDTVDVRSGLWLSEREPGE